MAVTLIVETGTGSTTANALVSLADLKTYFADRGTDISAFADSDLNAAIVRASAFLANAFNWGGLKVNQRAQTMPFPRTGVVDREGWVILQNEIPREVVAACCEIALAEATTPGTMNPTVVSADLVRSEQVGPIRTEYALLFNNPSDKRPVLAVVQDLLWPFLENGQGNVLSGQTERV